MSSEPRYDCAVDATMSIIEGRWKVTILCLLAKNETLRFSELRKKIPPISPRILTKQLRELTADKVIERNEIKEGSSWVEYSLTDRGRSLLPVLKELADWSLKNMFNKVIEIR
ncbi:MAG TPA: helix-turn-helix domain-containing protein [Candidatus Methanomethylophilaceae archaeon]|nr:helix-turn-helix domain-containing protein [Candidatus Methanomethylophilaceae archaeon]